MHIAAKQSPPFLEGFVLNSEKKKVYTVSMVPYGFYKVQDRYFQDFPSPEDRYMHNKSENRPYYLSLQDQNGIIWLLPMSSQVEKYKRKIEADERRYGTCTTCYILPFMGGERAVLIGNMIPVIQEYIAGEYTIANRHYIVKNQDAIKAIRKRTNKYLTLVRQGRLRPYVDILATERKLLQKLADQT